MHAREAAVLEWLLELPEVGRALDLSLEDRESEALDVLVPCLWSLLPRKSPDPGAARARSRSGRRRPAARADEIAAGEADEAAAGEADEAEAGGAGEAVAGDAGEAAAGEAGEEAGEAAAGSLGEPCWIMDLPEVSSILAQGAQQLLPAGFVPPERPHAELVDMGAGQAAPSPFTSGSMEALRGKTFEVTMWEIIVAEDVACGTVTLPPEVPCAGSAPHVVLGTLPDCPPGRSREVAQLSLQGDRAGQGLTAIRLPTPRVLRGTVQLLE